MKQLVILSGKGGTGKTTVAAALVHLASQEAPIVFADADVDAANLELVLDPTVQETHHLDAVLGEEHLCPTAHPAGNDNMYVLLGQPLGQHAGRMGWRSFSVYPGDTLLLGVHIHDRELITMSEVEA